MSTSGMHHPPFEGRHLVQNNGGIGYLCMLGEEAYVLICMRSSFMSWGGGGGGGK